MNKERILKAYKLINARKARNIQNIHVSKNCPKISTGLEEKAYNY